MNFFPARLRGKGGEKKKRRKADASLCPTGEERRKTWHSMPLRYFLATVNTMIGEKSSRRRGKGERKEALTSLKRRRRKRIEESTSIRNEARVGEKNSSEERGRGKRGGVMQSGYIS